MGIFRRGSELKNSAGGKTIVTSATRITGELEHLAGDLHIEGQVDGTVVVAQDVSIGRLGKLTGLLECRNLYVAGSVDVKVACEVLEVLPGGSFCGEVICQQFVVDEQARFRGQRYEFIDKCSMLSRPDCLQILKNDQGVKSANLKRVVQESDLI